MSAPPRRRPSKLKTGVLLGAAAIMFAAIGITAFSGGRTTRIAQAAAPSIRVNAGPDSAQHWTMGSLGKTLTSFSLTNNNTEDIHVDALTVYVSSTPVFANTASTTLKNFKLVNASSSVQYGGTVYRAVPGPSPQRAKVTFTGLNVTIPRYSSLPLVVKNDVSGLSQAISGSSHQAFIGNVSGDGSALVARGAITGTAATLSGTVFSFAKIVYAGVVRMRLNPTSPAGTVAPASEQIIAKYHIWSDQPYARQPAIGGYTIVSLQSTITTRAVRTLRLYRGSVNPAYLLGSANLEPGPLGGRWVSLNASPFTINNLPASPGTLILTLDTRDAAANTTLVASLNALAWTDTITRGIPKPIDLPISGNLLRY